MNVGRAHKIDRTNDCEHQDAWLYPNYRAWVDDTGGKPLSSRRFTGLVKTSSKTGSDSKASSTPTICMAHVFAAFASDAPVMRTSRCSSQKPPPITDMTGSMTDETRASPTDMTRVTGSYLVSIDTYLPFVLLAIHQGE